MEAASLARELFAEAFETATGRAMDVQAPTEGRTDRLIFDETARLNGLDVDAAAFARFARALAEAHARRAAEFPVRGRAMPGAAAALAALARRREIVQTVVTGNVRPAAKVKLDAFGLGRYMDWRVSACGDDEHNERADLVRLAVERAAELGESRLPPVVVGDTPFDVAGAAAAGAHVVAVATGCSTALELREAGADHVLPDLTSTEDLVGLLTTVGRVAVRGW